MDSLESHTFHPEGIFTLIGNCLSEYKIIQKSLSISAFSSKQVQWERTTQKDSYISHIPVSFEKVSILFLHNQDERHDFSTSKVFIKLFLWFSLFCSVSFLIITPAILRNIFWMLREYSLEIECIQTQKGVNWGAEGTLMRWPERRETRVINWKRQKCSTKYSSLLLNVFKIHFGRNVQKFSWKC